MEVTQFPHYRPANKTERRIIVDTFGEENLPSIELFLNDIMDVYPSKNIVWAGMPDNHYQVIGCCASRQTYFYMLQGRNIYLIHGFSTFPVNERTS